jgi:hypothetical protein
MRENQGATPCPVSPKPMVDAAFGEVLVTCEKIKVPPRAPCVSQADGGCRVRRGASDMRENQGATPCPVCLSSIF